MRGPLRRGRVLKVGLVVVLAAVTALVIGLVATTDATPPSGDRRTVAAFIGDSDTAGAGATSASLRWTSLASRSLGWREVNFGRPSTGYATTSSGEVCGQQICPPYGDLLDQVIALHPAVVVVAGGQSDWRAWRDDPNDVGDAIDSVFDTLQRRLPSARIVAVSPVEPPDAAQAAVVDDIAADVRRSARQHGITYVDLLDPNVLSSADDVAANRFAPNDSGHRAIAQRFEEALS